MVQLDCKILPTALEIKMSDFTANIAHNRLYERGNEVYEAVKRGK